MGKCILFELWTQKQHYLTLSQLAPLSTQAPYAHWNRCVWQRIPAHDSIVSSEPSPQLATPSQWSKELMVSPFLQVNLPLNQSKKLYSITLKKTLKITLQNLNTCSLLNIEINAKCKPSFILTSRWHSISSLQAVLFPVSFTKDRYVIFTDDVYI